MQILLARNTYQLEKIAEKLNQFENKCGGQTSEVATTLSVRKDLMGVNKPTEAVGSTETLDPAERFREVLSPGYVPVDKRIRYSTDDTVGSLMARDPEILSGTFFIDLTDFANLELSCNAKVQSVAVNLVGENLGDARPTVTLLYDGTSKLRSCQPGIAEYVDTIGETATRYGKISRFRTKGRSTSPVATTQGFGDSGGQTSQTLAGLPLASQYTLLIDKNAGKNGSINWSNLEDIELKLEYTYQDVFPEGQCEL